MRMEINKRKLEEDSDEDDFDQMNVSENESDKSNEEFTVWEISAIKRSLKRQKTLKVPENVDEVEMLESYLEQTSIGPGSMIPKGEERLLKQRYSTSVATIIGISTYDPEEAGILEQIDAAESDTKNLEDLVQTFGFKSTISLCGNQSTKLNTLATLQKIFKQEEEQFLFFFFGHSFEYKESTYLCLCDYKENNPISTSIKLDAILERNGELLEVSNIELPEDIDYQPETCLLWANSLQLTSVDWGRIQQAANNVTSVRLTNILHLKNFIANLPLLKDVYINNSGIETIIFIAEKLEKITLIDCRFLMKVEFLGDNDSLEEFVIAPKNPRIQFSVFNPAMLDRFDLSGE